MAKRKSAMQLVREFKEKNEIDPYRGMRLRDINDIYDNSNNDVCSMIMNAFVFGYIKGQRAEKARRVVK